MYGAMCGLQVIWDTILGERAMNGTMGGIGRTGAAGGPGNQSCGKPVGLLARMNANQLANR